MAQLKMIVKMTDQELEALARAGPIPLVAPNGKETVEIGTVAAKKDKNGKLYAEASINEEIDLLSNYDMCGITLKLKREE